MEYTIHFALGLAMAYVGLLPPGMINMTVVRTRLSSGSRPALLFSGGAAVVVLLQAGAALIFANYFNNNPQVLDRLVVAGGVVFLALAVFFYTQGSAKTEYKGQATKTGHFINGMLLSSLNMLSLPFYLGLSTLLSMRGLVVLDIPHIAMFVVGASVGAFLLFVTYSSFARLLSVKASFIASNINYVLSLLFLILGVYTLYDQLK